MIDDKCNYLNNSFLVILSPQHFTASQSGFAESKREEVNDDEG